MGDYIAQFLVVLMTLLIGFCFGYIIGCMNRVGKIYDADLGEHECDAPRPPHLG